MQNREKQCTTFGSCNWPENNLGGSIPIVEGNEGCALGILSNDKNSTQFLSSHGKSISMDNGDEL